MDSDIADSDDLGFASAVRAAFAFLESDYNMRCIADAPFCVKYESDAVSLELRFDRHRSYEIEQRFRIAGGDRSFSTADVLDAVVGQDDLRPRWFQATSRDSVREALTSIAQVTRTLLGRALIGDRSLFAMVEARTRQRERDETNWIVHSPIRAQADEAWRERDLARVIGLLESIEGDLTDVERRRLDYARAHASL